jgi:peptidylprolyl isomerase
VYLIIFINMPPYVQSTESVPQDKKTNPVCYFDVIIGSNPIGRISIQLFAEKCPKTVENFRALCTGEKVNKHGRRLHYKTGVLHSVYPNWAIVGGDIVNNNGTSGESIYGPYFADESHEIKHDRPGIVSMLNFKNNTNNSQFVISMAPAPSLDGQCPAFGRVISGMEVLRKIENMGSTSGVPSKQITIADCGQLPCGLTTDVI